MAIEEIEVLHEFDKGRALVRVYLSVYNGKQYCHIREFVEMRDKPGELIPTKAGISVAVEDLEELEEAVRVLRAAVSTRPSPKRRAR